MRYAAWSPGRPAAARPPAARPAGPARPGLRGRGTYIGGHIEYIQYITTTT